VRLCARYRADIVITVVSIPLSFLKERVRPISNPTPCSGISALADNFRNGSPQEIADDGYLANMAVVLASMELCLAVDFCDQPEWHETINRQLREWFAMRIEAGLEEGSGIFKPSLPQRLPRALLVTTADK